MGIYIYHIEMDMNIYIYNLDLSWNQSDSWSGIFRGIFKQKHQSFNVGRFGVGRIPNN